MSPLSVWIFAYSPSLSWFSWAMSDAPDSKMINVKRRGEKMLRILTSHLIILTFTDGYKLSCQLSKKTGGNITYICPYLLTPAPFPVLIIKFMCWKFNVIDQTGKIFALLALSSYRNRFLFPELSFRFTDQQISVIWWTRAAAAIRFIWASISIAQQKAGQGLDPRCLCRRSWCCRSAEQKACSRRG